MGGGLVLGLLDAGRIPAAHIAATDVFEGVLQPLAEVGVQAGSEISLAVRGRDVVILAVKPQLAATVLQEIAPLLEPDQVLVSIMAGVVTATIEAQVGGTVPDEVGSTVAVSETQMDAVTGLSGSGPAYVYTVIEALAAGGVLMGLSREDALQLAAQTVLGAARMVIESGQHPAILKDQITSPGGTTIAGLHKLEEKGLRDALISAVQAATQRSVELGKS